jgi:hypothetical protein
MPSETGDRAWRRRVTCEDVADLLPGMVDGAHTADKRAQRHVESCLRCQAELARYRRLLRALRQLRGDLVNPGPGLLAEILAGLEEPGEPASVRIVNGRRAAYLGGVAVATAAAGAAGAIVLVSRASRRRVGLAG